MARIDALQAENADLRAQLAREQTALDAWMQKTNALQRRISALQQPAPPAQPDAVALVAMSKQQALAALAEIREGLDESAKRMAMALRDLREAAEALLVRSGGRTDG